MAHTTDKTTSNPAATATGAAIGGVAGGVAGGAAAGAAVGGMTGPVGAAVGAAVGAVAGALAGKGLARSVDPVAEDTYWRSNYSSRPYVTSGRTYDDYAPAYKYGADAYTNYPDRSFDDLESDLSRDWNKARGRSSLEWEHAKHATRDAWNRLSDKVERAIPGDSDGDGRYCTLFDGSQRHPGRTRPSLVDIMRGQGPRPRAGELPAQLR